MPAVASTEVSSPPLGVGGWGAKPKKNRTTSSSLLGANHDKGQSKWLPRQSTTNSALWHSRSVQKSGPKKWTILVYFSGLFFGLFFGLLFWSIFGLVFVLFLSIFWPNFFLCAKRGPKKWTIFVIFTVFAILSMGLPW